MKYYWDKFWYETYRDTNISYGGISHDKKTFRKQRLFNIIIVIIVIAIFILK